MTVPSLGLEMIFRDAELIYADLDLTVLVPKVTCLGPAFLSWNPGIFPCLCVAVWSFQKN